MLYDLRDSRAFAEGELAGLRAAQKSADVFRSLSAAAWYRAEADRLRLCSSADPCAADERARAAQERFRAARREAIALRDEVAEFEYDLGKDGWEDDL